jgi:hypothetical protein
MNAARAKRFRREAIFFRCNNTKIGADSRRIF